MPPPPEPTLICLGWNTGYWDALSSHESLRFIPETFRKEELTERSYIVECLPGWSWPEQLEGCWCHLLNRTLGKIDFRKEIKAFVLAKLCLYYMSAEMPGGQQIASQVWGWWRVWIRERGVEVIDFSKARESGNDPQRGVLLGFRSQMNESHRLYPKCSQLFIGLFCWWPQRKLGKEMKHLSNIYHC